MKPVSIIEALHDAGIKAENISVFKNGIECQGIRIINSEDESVSPVVYYSSNETIEEIVNRVKTMLNNTEIPIFNIDVLTSKDYFKNHAFLAIQRKSFKDDLLKRNFLNLEIYIRLNIGETDDAIGSVGVTESFLESVGFSENDAFKFAIKNSKEQIEVMTLGEALGIHEELNLPPLYYVTTNGGLYGSAAIYYPEIFEDICVNEGYNKCIILPSSVNELIIAAGDFSDEDYKGFANMVRSINEQEVAEILRLDPMVYSYDIRNGLFKIEATSE